MPALHGHLRQPPCLSHAPPPPRLSTQVRGRTSQVGRVSGGCVRGGHRLEPPDCWLDSRSNGDFPDVPTRRDARTPCRRCAISAPGVRGMRGPGARSEAVSPIF
eukprot:scaffold27431_cov140-Isochrysis_galbana.AAC.4